MQGGSRATRDVKLPVTVQCICRAVQIAAHAAPLGVMCCHCPKCQHISGTDYQHNAYFAPDKIKVVADESNLLTMDIPGDSGCRQCCSNCKVPVMHTAFATDGRTPIRVTLPVGVITSKAGPLDPAWAPQAHICYCERARDVLDDIPKWPGADTEAQQWKQEDGPADAAVPADAAALPPLPPPPIVAACRCGQTKVEGTATPAATYYCHCSSCQQLSGADFAHNAVFHGGNQLRVTAGKAQLSVYRKGASPRVTFRCGRCLVRVFRQQEAADGSVLGQVLGVGTVDKPHGLADPAWQPRFHMFYSERAADMADNLPKWSGLPEKSERMDVGDTQE